MTTKNHYELLKKHSIVDKVTGCWEWQRATHVQGYGLVRHGGTMKTIQRVMAIELKLAKNINFSTRIGTSCNNKLCCNPDHIIIVDAGSLQRGNATERGRFTDEEIIAQTRTEVLKRRYENEGTGGRFEGMEMELRAEYFDMKANKIPRTINILAEKYDAHPMSVYKAIHKANEADTGKMDLRKI